MKSRDNISPESNRQLRHVFVYGTLKRGECREGCWPCKAVSVEAAWTLGGLIDLGAYPALLTGQERVLGELWSFHPDDIEIVFEALDRVEVTNQPGVPNEYDRVCVKVVVDDARGEIEAAAYRLADVRVAAQYPRMSASHIVDGCHYIRWTGCGT